MNTESKYIKSPINYAGSKYRLLKKIIPLFPNEIHTFVDLFGGAFNVGINVNAKRVIYNDIINYLPELFEYWNGTDLEEINNYIDIARSTVMGTASVARPDYSELSDRILQRINQI